MKKTALVRYSPEVGMDICLLVAEGKSIAEISKMPDMPSRSGIHSWVTLYPEFGRALRAAREISAETFEERALAVADDLAGENNYTGTKVRALEVAIQQWRWSAARRDPKRYGEQKDTKVVVPIQINTSLDLGDGAAGGLSTPDHPNVYEIKAEVVQEGVGDPTPFDEALEVKDQELWPRKKIGRPTIASKRHKTAKGIGATVSQQKRKAKLHPRVKEILGIAEKEPSDGNT